MPILSTVSAQTTHRALVYGGPKSGKTELVGNLSLYFNLLWFDCEKGYATLLKLPKAQQERINLISLPDTRTFPIAIETMLKVITGAAVEVCEEHGKVACGLCKKDSKLFTRICLSELTPDTIVVLDSMTQLANSTMAHITKGQSDDYKYEWDDYRKQGTLMDKFLSSVQQANYNIVVITHEVEAELEDGRKKIVPAAGTANFSRNTAKYFDHIVYCEVKNKKHNFGSSTTFGMSLVTGSRTDVEIEKGTVPSLLDIFKGGSSAKLPNSPNSVGLIGANTVGNTGSTSGNVSSTGVPKVSGIKPAIASLPSVPVTQGATALSKLASFKTASLLVPKPKT
jgi:hypothetical protein